MKRLLNSRTSLTLCMALVVPGITPTFAVAQATDTVVCGAVESQETYPCAVEEGALMGSETELRQYRQAQGGVEEETVETQEAAPQDEAAEAAASAAQAAEEQAALKQALKDEEAAAAQAKAAEAEAAERAATEAAAQAEQTAAAEAEASAAAALKAEEEATRQADLEKALKEEQAAAAAVEAEPQPEADVAPAAEAAPEAVAETTPAAEAGVAAEADTPQQATDAVTPTEEQPETVEAQAARKAERQAERRAEREVELEAARKALEEEPAGEIITEEVTTESIRRSDEDFETKATGTPEVKKDSGLSNLEKALLVGLGAIVVGTVLKNGDKVLSNSGDRVVVQDEGGELRVLKDDDALLRRPGDEVQTERFNDGSTRQIVQKPDGSRIVTIRSSNGTVLRRIRFDAFGNETILFDDLAEEREVVVQDLPQIIVQPFASQDLSEADLRAALIAQQRGDEQRSFSLRQVREINEVRALAPQIELDAARFASGSAAIAPEQARSLSRVGNTLRQLIADDPRTVFLIEGHTDAVGDASYNLALSDRRAETVALALTEYFDVPPENMITQGYGESALRVQTPLAEQANRRAVVRNITNLLRQVSN
jgi:outer membrane protein OmpA-like peptidoglycan-associated protein